MKTLIRIEETMIGALLVLSMMIWGGCSSVQPSAHIGSRVHVVVIMNTEEVHNGMIRPETSFAVNVNGTWSTLRKLPYKKSEGGYNSHGPTLTEATLVAALQQSDVPENQEVMLSIYDGHQTTAPVLIGTFDGETIVKPEEAVVAEF
jgi:hypothetical protein